MRPTRYNKHWTLPLTLPKNVIESVNHVLRDYFFIFGWYSTHLLASSSQRWVRRNSRVSIFTSSRVILLISRGAPFNTTHASLFMSYLLLRRNSSRSAFT